MKRQFTCCFVYIFAIILFFGCDNPEQDIQIQQLNVRASFRSNGNGTIRTTVIVEGPDGNALSGAVVFVKDDRNSSLQLNYETSTCSYTGLLTENSGETIYTVEVASILSDDIISITVPYTKMENIPNVIVFQDAAGNSVLNGQTLRSNQPIQIGWADCGEGVVYQIRLGTIANSHYIISTNACTVTIPAGTIPAGSHILEITAQKISGDVFFRTSPYYSYSFTRAPWVNCNVN
jgi:hypothetical protein